MALPGIANLIADGQLRIPPTASGTKLTIVGTTTSATLPLLEPIAITDGYLGIAACHHSDGKPSELSLALEEALLAGAQNIEVLCIESTSGELDAYTSNERWDALLTAYEALRPHRLDIVHLAGAHIDDGTLDGVDANSATRDNFGKQLANFLWTSTLEGNPAYGVIGVQPILRRARKASWPDAPGTLSGEYFDYPSRADLTEWTYHLTGSASGIDHSTEELTTSGFLAGSDEESKGVVSNSYDFWARTTTGGTIRTDQYGVKVDGAGRLSVVAGACRARGSETNLLIAQYGATDKTTRNTNGAAGYAGFLSTLPPHRGATNKNVPGLISAREFNHSQLDSILTDRFVTFYTNGRGFVTLKAITGAYNASIFTRSDFVNTTTVLITDAAAEAIGRAALPFIGEPINDINLGALDAAINDDLRKLQTTGALRRFSFRIEATPYQQVLGEASVFLTLVPAFELFNLTTYISLSVV